MSADELKTFETIPTAAVQRNFHEPIWGGDRWKSSRVLQGIHHKHIVGEAVVQCTFSAASSAALHAMFLSRFLLLLLFSDLASNPADREQRKIKYRETGAEGATRAAKAVFFHLCVKWYRSGV